MSNGFRIDVGTKQSLSLRVDPKVVLSGQLLELNTIELQATIQAELVENPALEWLDEGLSDITIEDIYASVAPSELKNGSEDREFQRSRPNDAEENDWMDLVASYNSLEDHLEAQLFHLFDNTQIQIAEMIIGSLDDRGYLDAETEQIAMDYNFDLEMVEEVLAKIQTCEPAGIGARNVKECLEIQLAKPSNDEERLALDIVKHSFEDLVNRNVRGIMRQYKVMPELVHEAFEVIVSCSPFPAETFDRDNNWRTDSKRPGVPVDMIIARNEVGWSVEIPGIDHRSLIVARAYREQFIKIKDSKVDDEKRHLSQCVSRAQQFIEALGQRHSTLMRVGYYLIDQQSGFVTTGNYEFLRSLTRRKMAADLGLHESTISRATAGKHIQLVNGEVISFDIIFKPALRIQYIISEILQTENPDNPMSDERITQILSEKGIVVARRTVNKYRDRSKTLSSRRRRSA